MIYSFGTLVRLAATKRWIDRAQNQTVYAVRNQPAEQPAHKSRNPHALRVDLSALADGQYLLAKWVLR
jgi:hypothetical protein